MADADDLSQRVKEIFRSAWDTRAGQVVPDPEDLKALRARVGEDPDKVAKFETYVTLLAALDTAIDDGDAPERLSSLRKQIRAAKRSLRF